MDGAVERGRHQVWGDCVMILATTALRISEAAGLEVGDIDLNSGLLAVRRQTYPGRGGLITKETKGRRRRSVPIIEPLRDTLTRPTVGRAPGQRLLIGPRGGVVSTATCVTPRAGINSSTIWASSVWFGMGSGIPR